MKYALLCDVHSNLEALTATLTAVDKLGVDEVVCLGDHVGHNANPDECVALLRARGGVAIAGTHDRAAAGLADDARFGAHARRAISWTRAKLSPDCRRYLAALPDARIFGGSYLAFRGARPPESDRDVYATSPARIRRSFDALAGRGESSRIGFFGHTHRALVHELSDARLSTHREATVALRPAARYLVNPGSVGHARPDDPRASFAVFDDTDLSVRRYRVEYDHRAARAKAERAGLVSPARPPAGRLGRLIAWVAVARDALQTRLS